MQNKNNKTPSSPPADPQGRPTVFENLPEHMPRVISVGRLDLTSEGLLLLTNDGELARMLELPSTAWARRYRARAYGRITQDRLDTLKKGITIDGVPTGPIEATIDRQQGDNAWIDGAKTARFAARWIRLGFASIASFVSLMAPSNSPSFPAAKSRKSRTVSFATKSVT